MQKNFNNENLIVKSFSDTNPVAGGEPDTTDPVILQLRRMRALENRAAIRIQVF